MWHDVAWCFRPVNARLRWPASPLIAENAGSPWLFRLVIAPAHRCSRRRLLFEAACSRGRELALCKGALAAEHRQDADLQLKGRHVSWRSCAIIAICHTSLARSCYRRDGAGRCVFFLWPVGQPQTQTRLDFLCLVVMPARAAVAAGAPVRSAVFSWFWGVGRFSSLI